MILIIAVIYVFSKQSGPPILCHRFFTVPLIVKLMRRTCRVPLQLLALRLSILYLRTCVGLGYGSII